MEEEGEVPEGTGRSPREPSLLDGIVPLVALAGLIAASLALFGLDALDGPVQVALMLCCAVAALIAMKNGHAFPAVQEVGRGAVASVTSAIFILLAVGALIGVWNLSGTIPTLVYYGIEILSPGWFYVATALISGIVAMSIGSSWTTAGTIGVGLVGVAGLIGVSPEITAGAVISGAYLGDKTSPLSETTILTAQIVGVDTYEHIKRQVWTSVPAFVIALVVFAVLGVTGPDTVSESETTSDLAGLDTIYNITPFALLPLLLLGYLSARKVPATLALLASTLFAGALGAFLQPDVYRAFVAGGGNVMVECVKAVWLAMSNGFSIDSGIPDVDRLLSRGGAESMLLTIWLILGAVTFGAMLEEFGLIRRLIDPLIASAKSQGRLFLTVFGCGFGLNLVAGDQYIALVMPSRLFRAEFAARDLAPTNLSRLAADSATVTSPLVPWNSCGAFMGSTLGVATLLYAPYAVFCYASPALSVLYGFTGFRIEKLDATPPVEGNP
jgi:NhaC family Na+:H+ antiporter